MKEGAKGRTSHAKANNETTTHVIKQAYKHKPDPYPHFSIDFKHREVREDGGKKAESYGMARDHEETMVWRTSILRTHTTRTTPTTQGWVSKPSMLEMRSRAPKGPRMHTQAYKHEHRQRNHETPKARKVQDDGDKVKEKQGMKPHPPPHPHNMHTLSL